MINLTNLQTRRFILLKQGLLGEYKYIGKQGVLDYIREAGCIQFDPVDLCGKNAEITLQARVKGFKKEMLSELLYKDRVLFDYPDKQLSIIPTEYWAYFERFRVAARNNLVKHPEIEEHIGTVFEHLEKNSPVCSNDFHFEGDTKWWSAINWSAGGKLSRSVLEQLYSSGDLVVHHKKGTRRYYDLSTRHIPHEFLFSPEPLPDDFSHMKWRVMRRIGAAGLLWSRKSSGALLNIWGLTSGILEKIFDALLEEGEIIELAVEGVKNRFFIKAEDMSLLEDAMSGAKYKHRCEFVAPLDPFMWDKKIIEMIFGFMYTWEIYTPAHTRKYGAYVLPILCGERFVGRIEVVCNRKIQSLEVKNIWYEEGVRQTKKLEKEIAACIKRFASFNECRQ